MTSTANPVTPGPTVVFQGGVVAEPQSAVIYTCNQTDPERIESVYMQADFSVRTDAKDIASLQLIDASGVVLYEQATPPILGVNNAEVTAFLTWSRLGNDSAQLAALEQLFANDNIRRVWCNMRLPDLVLQPRSYLRLLYWVDDGGEAGPITVTNIAVTVTRNAGSVSDTTAVQGIPLLTDISTV